jgi:glycine dehydrogenase subunit 1
MPFIPHTESDIRAMLEAVGASSLEDLFDEIPAELKVASLDVPAAVGEMEIQRLMRDRAGRDAGALNFIGAGAYEHHIPAAVWEITTRGEFYSAYTPYQAEASQGTLQLIYEYQSMMTALTGLDCSNASLYDGASALAEACLMAVRANRASRSSRILMPATVNPAYRRTCAGIAGGQGLDFQPVGYDEASGAVDPAALSRWDDEDVTALVIQQPNFYGRYEDVAALTEWARGKGALVIAVVNPTSLAILEPPGRWGEGGADIACGEGQALGVPLSSGGPYFGFLACRQALVRQMPGRIVGRTVDVDGRVGYALTLQAREQHIRRSKATSNICTNQGLMVTAATIYMSLLGAEGLARVAAACVRNTARLVERLGEVDGVRRRFADAVFHECVLELDRPVAPVLETLAQRGIVGGFDLSNDYPELGNALLVCATETRTEADIETYHRALEDIMRQVQVA